MEQSQFFFEKTSVESQVHALYYGILITAICFNLFVFLALRESIYLYYVLSTLGYLILIGTLNGITYQFIWPALPGLQSNAMSCPYHWPCFSHSCSPDPF